MHYIMQYQDNTEFLVLLPLPTEYRDYGHVPAHPIYEVLRITSGLFLHARKDCTNYILNSK